MKYRLVRSGRKTISIEIRGQEILVRAPYRAPQAQIDQFIFSKKAWIEKHLEKNRARAAEEAQERERTGAPGRLTMEDLQELGKKALEVIPRRAAFYAPKVGVTYGRITIRNQRTRWGSCSAKGNLNFNCLLMLTPPEVLDSVVVHELCHRLEMNHSKRFYENVYRVFPEYDKWHGWLKEHGPALMKRMTG